MTRPPARRGETSGPTADRARARPGQRVRLFVALDPDARSRARLAARRNEVLDGRPDLRLPPAETLHVTLAFLGHRSRGDVRAVEAATFAATQGLRPARLRPDEIVTVPPRRPRLVALDLLDPEGRATAAANAVNRALAEAGLHTPERRPYWPHVTLARVRGSGRGERPLAPLPTARWDGAPEGDDTLVFDRVVLYRSHLGPGGARYEELAQVRLTG